MNVLTSIILLVGCFLAFLVAFAVFTFIQLRPRLRALRELGPTPVARAKDGDLLVVAGRVGGAELRSPLTDTPCVFWQVTVEHGTAGYERIVFDRRSAEPFTIDDGSAEVQVQPADAELFLDRRMVTAFKPFGRNYGAIKAALQRIGAPQALFMQAYERCLVPGDAVVAKGVINCTSRPPVLASTGRQRLVLSDRPLAEYRSQSYRTAWASIALAAIILGSFAALIVAAILLNLR
jgi:hypothetical protein